MTFTLTLALDRVILHTVVYHSSTSTYLHTKFQWYRTNVLWSDGRTYARIRTDKRTDIWDQLY